MHQVVDVSHGVALPQVQAESLADDGLGRRVGRAATRTQGWRGGHQGEQAQDQVRVPGDNRNEWMVSNV